MNREIPLVSIVTPCYNGEKYLSRYFESILNQTYPNLEVVFVNDGSTDRTEETVNQYKSQLNAKGIRLIYQYQPNAGQAAALNRGLKLFTGEYLTWPDADDEMTPDSIEKKVNYLESHPEISMVRSNGVFRKPSGETRRISEHETSEPKDLFEDLLYVKTYGCDGCYMIRSKLFFECYPDRDIFESRTGQNWQVLLPAASRTLCGYIDEDLYIVNEHDDSHSRSKRTPLQEWTYWKGFIEILLHAVEVSDCDREKYRKEIRRIEAEQHYYYAITTNDPKLISSSFRTMKKYRKPAAREYLLFCKKMADAAFRRNKNYED